MRQLHPHLTKEQAFIDQVQRQLVEGYYLVAIIEFTVKRGTWACFSSLPLQSPVS